MVRFIPRYFCLVIFQFLQSKITIYTTLVVLCIHITENRLLSLEVVQFIVDTVYKQTS